MENNFQPIRDAYQLSEGSIVKGRNQEEVFELGSYDVDKKGYLAFPYEKGARFSDFGVLVTESELMDNYLIQMSKPDEDESGERNLLSDAI